MVRLAAGALIAACVVALGARLVWVTEGPGACSRPITVHEDGSWSPVGWSVERDGWPSAACRLEVTR